MTELERTLVRTTPLVPGPALQQRVGPVLLKLENLQRTGSFKLRGAARKLAHLAADARARGVVAASAGNHGAGVALAAHTAGIAATIVVPEHTPRVKRERMTSAGAEVVVRGADYDRAEAHARELAGASGRTFVSPFDDEDVIEGNGASLARELLTQARDLAMVVCSVGGGGLISGLARTLAPRGIRVVGVQPAANCAMYESLQRGVALTRYDGRPTLAEGCEGAVAQRTYELVREHVDRIVLVEEDQIRRAVVFAYRQLGTIAECSAAVALAGLLEGRIEPAASGSTACIVTGGNIDPEHLDELLRWQE